MKNSVALTDLCKVRKGKKVSCNVVCKEFFQTVEIARFIGKDSTKHAFNVLNGVEAGPFRKECTNTRVVATDEHMCLESYGDNGLMCVDVILSNKILVGESEYPQDVYTIITLGQENFSVIGEQQNLFGNKIELIGDISAVMKKAKETGDKRSTDDFDFFMDEDIKWFVKETARTQCTFMSPFKEKVLRNYSCNHNFLSCKGRKRFSYNELQDLNLGLAGLFMFLR